MIVETIREKLKRVPFRPFVIRVGGGQSHIVRNPELVVLMKSSVFVAAANSDRSVTVRYPDVAAVEPLTNGHTRRFGRSKRGR